MEKASFIKINPADSVVVCLRPFNKGEQINVDGKDITLAQDTPAGHKVLINDTAKGENIIKYGSRYRNLTQPKVLVIRPLIFTGILNS